MTDAALKISRSQKRAAETRRRLYEVALRLFLEKGFENTTVSEITDEVDVAKGTFFTHFPTKESVMGELGSIVLEHMEAAARKLQGQRTTIEAQVLGLFDAAGRWHEANREMSRLAVRLLTVSPGGMEADRQNQLRCFSLLLGLVKRGQQAGEFSTAVSPEIATQTLGGVYFSAVLSWHFSPVPLPLRTMLAEGIGLVTKGLRP